MTRDIDISDHDNVIGLEVGREGSIVYDNGLVTAAYTVAQIKAAFWREFHKGGERWFNYLGSETDNEECTQSEWDSFLEELQAAPEEVGDVVYYDGD